MSRFKKGEKVWFGKGERAKQYIVEKVIDNPMLPVYQYTFEGESFACGEQSLREEQFGEERSLRECYKESNKDQDDNTATRINTAAMMHRQPIDIEDFGVGDSFSGSLFFKPDLKFVEWLRDYADGRLIIDVGAGQGHLVRMLKMTKAKAMGLEPNFGYSAVMEYSASRGVIPNPNEILAMAIEMAKGLINGLGNKALLVFARPCHTDFVETGIRNMPDDTEALYITVPENLDIYNDLGEFSHLKQLLKHEGISEDSEIVYSIKKN